MKTPDILAIHPVTAEELAGSSVGGPLPSPDPIDVIRALLAVIENNATFPYGKTDEDDKAIAVAETLVTDRDGLGWWARASR